MPNVVSITGQRETTQLLGGRFIPGVEITWLADNGVSGTAFVPLDRYNVTAARDAVHEAAAQRLAVHNLEIKVG